jgi:AcrR family transcriptional regulator
MTEYTGARARTRAVILDAAATTLAVDSSASMAKIAEVAGVGRATIHRYFPERRDLISALTDVAVERIVAAHARARLSEGTARSAVSRLMAEYAEDGPLIRLIHSGVLPDEEVSARAANLGEVTGLLPRGIADGSIDPTLDEAWFLGVMWALSQVAFELLADPANSKHAVTQEYLKRVDAAIRP